MQAARRAIEGYIRKNAAEFKNLEFSEKAIEIALGDGVSVAGRIDLVRRIDTGEVTIVDLKSNDLEQIRLERDLKKLGYRYIRKRQSKSETRRADPKKYKAFIKKEELAKAGL